MTDTAFKPVRAAIFVVDEYNFLDVMQTIGKIHLTDDIIHTASNRAQVITVYRQVSIQPVIYINLQAIIHAMDHNRFTLVRHNFGPSMKSIRTFHPNTGKRFPISGGETTL